MTNELLQELKRYMDRMHENVPGLISVSAVQITTGKTILHKSKNNEDVNELNRLQTSTVKYALKGLEYVHNLKVKKFEDIVITTDEQIHVLMTSEIQSFMSYIILDAKNANLTLTQRFHKQFYGESVQTLMNKFGVENIKNHPFFQQQDLTIEKDIISSGTIQDSKEGKKSGGFFSSLFSNS